MEILSGVNRKTMVMTACLIMAGILSACKADLTDAYSVQDNSIDEILTAEARQFHSTGFAETLCVPATTEDYNTENVNAEAFGHFDINRTDIISQKNLYERVYPASTTKILTCLLALELCDPEEEVIVPQESEITVSGSSMANLKPGDRIKIKDLLYGLMVPSGNDAAVAIAVHISGSVEEFAKLMNKKAVQLGATRTNFTNPHGLPDDNHYTCIYDMYLIFNEASKYDTFRTVSSTKEYTATIFNTSDQTERTVTWTSGNGFYNEKFSLKDDITYYGGKTGHTNAAGFCLVLGTVRKGMEEYISIIMKAPGYEDLYHGMQELTSK